MYPADNQKCVSCTALNLTLTWLQEHGVPTLAPMAALELACAAGVYIHPDREPLVANATFGANLTVLDGSILEITCNLMTGAQSVQNLLCCTLVHLSEVPLK